MTRLADREQILNLVMSLILIAVIPLFHAEHLSAATMPSSSVLGAIDENIDRPVRVYVDGTGKLYISDTDSNTVQVYSNNGVLLFEIDGLSKPVGVGVDGNGIIYIGEKTPGRVSVYDETGTFLFKLGSGDGEFMLPSDIAVSLSGNVYVTDSKKELVGVYGSDGGHLFSFGNGQLGFPTGIAIDEGAQEVYVVNHNYKSIYIYDMNGSYRRQIRGGGGMMGGGNLHAAQGIAVDETRVFIADSYNSAVAVYDKNGLFLGYVGQYGENAGEMRIPLDVSFDNDGKLFVTNNNNGRVEILGVDAYTALTLSPSVVNISVFEKSSPLTQTVDISSNQITNWTAHESNAWLSLDAYSGSTPAPLVLTVDPSTLGAGSYRGIVTVTSEAGTEYAVAINLEVVPLQREFSVSPRGIELTIQKNAAAMPEAGIVLTSRNGSVEWTGSSNVSWLTLDRMSGVTPDNIKAVITDEAGTFEEGIRTGRLIIDAGEGVIGSPATVDVTLRVIVAGTLRVLSNHPDASFTLSGPVEQSGAGTEWVNTEMKPGTYTISFDHVSGFKRPASQTFTIETGRETVVKATYTARKSATHIVAAVASPGGKRSSLLTLDGMNGMVNGRWGSLLTLDDAEWISFGKKVSIFTLDGVEVTSFEPFVSAAPLRVATGDVNGDGVDEILVSDSRKRVKIYTFDGEEIGRMKLPFWLSLTGMTVGDVDGDGCDEILIATVEKRAISSGRGSMVRVYRFIDGGFSEEAPLYETEGIRALKIALGDMDGDGKVDLIISDDRQIRMVDMKNGDVTPLVDTGAFVDIPEIALGDLDNDGMDDLIVSGVNGRGTPRPDDDISFISILNGSQILRPFADAAGGRLAFIAVADIDGDNEDEIAAGMGTEINRFVRRGPEGLIRLYESDLTFGGETIDTDMGGSGVSIAFGVFK